MKARADDIRFEKLVADWRLYQWPRIRKNSQTIYGRMLDKHIVPAFDGRKLRTIKRRDVEQLQTKTAGTTGRVTANLVVTVLRILFTYAERHELVTSNPARGVSAVPQPPNEVRENKDEPILTPEELRRLWNAAEGVWRPLLMTVALTGLRKSEVMGLTWGDIDWNAGTLHVRHQLQEGVLAPPKTDAGYRAIAMVPELVVALKRWKLAAPKGPMDLVFCDGEGRPLQRHDIDRLGLHPALRRAGLRQVKLHWLRHGYGSLLISAGVSLKVVQVSMGHSSIQMTLDVYGHMMPGDNATAAAALARLFTGNFLGTSDAAAGQNTAATRAVAGG